MRGTRTSRRRFLGSAGRLALGGAGLTIVPRSVLGGPGGASPNDRLTMGFIGVGGMGGGHLGGHLGNRDIQILAVCEVDGGRREGAKRNVEGRYGDRTRSGEYKGCAAYKDFRELVARDDIDSVVIATPDHWHALTAIAAARAGKDIYCEKPMSLTIREARAMVNAVRRYGRVFQTGSQQRSGSEFHRACSLVRSGRIGEVKEVFVGVGGPSNECHLPAEPVPEGLDWDMWLGPAPERPFNKKLHPYNWRWYRDYSGGNMTDWGAHHFDIAQWGLGMDGSGPVEIIPPDKKDVKMLTYRYANGVLMYHGGRGGVTFKGTEGEIWVDRGKFSAKPESVAAPLGPGDVILRRPRGGHRGEWLHCIKTRERPICDVEIGARSVSVCHLGNIAYWLGRPLKWDPEREEIVGDPEAARWVDRPKRPPWRL